MDMHHDLGVPGVEVIHARQQPLRTERGQNRQVQCPAPGAEGNGLQRRATDSPQRRCQLMLIQGSGSRQLDTPPFAMEQLDPEQSLQCLHLAADSTLGQ